MKFISLGIRGALCGIVGLLLVAAAGGCGGSGGGGAIPVDGRNDRPAGDGGVDQAPPCQDGGATKKATGQACGCAGDCQSGFCVDGVCCNAACTETCKACNVPATLGTCSFVPAGLKPRSITTCAQSDASSCGLDGSCDGMGACRKYVEGTTCRAGICDGDAVTGINVCDGKGLCRPGAAKICAPFSCDAAKKECFTACTKNSDCVSGRQCVSGSCGKRPKGAACAVNADCVSGFCTDGVCCSVACQGGCVSCNLVGHEGTCWPIDPGNPDPRKVCKDAGSASCGQTGACDGFGGCEKYAAETICVQATCTGDRRNTPGTCDGQGTCRPPGVQDCPPYRCVGGACNTRCDSNADCQAGRVCQNGSCGPKQNGQLCTAAGECASGFCVDGVCCGDACAGACRSCALPSSMGRCTSIPAGTVDNRKMCMDNGAAACGTDGRCDGAGGCRKYAVGTVCAGEKCAGNVYTPPSACTATGQCMAPNSRPCAPFACNGQKCFEACTTAANCVPPNVCNGNSCGKKVNGASCSDAVECASNHCFQGVCCGTTCNNACKSCALPGTEGVCTNVPAGSTDPHNTCVDQGAGTCGTNGKCAAGACQRYAAGTSCKDPTCPANTATFTPRSTCDGSGMCITPSTSSCFPFACGNAACNGSCSANADCALGAVCINGSCGLKPKGASCAQTSECAVGLQCSAQGVCCDSLCNTACKSCTLTNTLGTCTAVGPGANDPNNICTDQGASSCGNDGKCDGAGACRKYASGTQCLAPMCSATYTLTNASACNGTGTCVSGGTRECDPYACSMNACNTACVTSADCKPPTICDPMTGMCGNKMPLGGSCTTSANCLTGHSCTDGVCCTTSSCGTCQACNVDGSGTCKNVPNGDMEPHTPSACPAAPPCGNTGACQNGACQQASVSTACGSASCSGSTFTPVGHCSGAGACTQPSQSCPPGYLCNTNNTCRTTCTLATDCAAGYFCTGSPGNPGSCTTKKALGDTCSVGSECLVGNCVNNVCCSTGSCPTCQACAMGSGMCTVTTGALCGGAASCTSPSGPHVSAGVCASDGMCSTASTSCNDNNACTTDSCDPQNGCSNTQSVVCAAPDQCHEAGVCNPGTGNCDYANKPPGTLCNDGMTCTTMDECVAGTCTGTAVTCPVGMSCDPGSGMCI